MKKVIYILFLSTFICYSQTGIGINTGNGVRVVNGRVVTQVNTSYNAVARDAIVRMPVKPSGEEGIMIKDITDTIIHYGIHGRLNLLYLFGQEYQPNSRINLLMNRFYVANTGLVYWSADRGFSAPATQLASAGYLMTDYNAARHTTRGYKYLLNDASIGAYLIDNWFDTLNIMGHDGITSRAFIRGGTGVNRTAMNSPITAANDTQTVVNYISTQRTLNTTMQTFIDGVGLTPITLNSNGTPNLKYTFLAASQGASWSSLGIKSRIMAGFLGGALTETQQTKFYQALDLWTDRKGAKNSDVIYENDVFMLKREYNRNKEATVSDKYRKLHLVGQNNNIKIAHNGVDTLMLSYDCGRTWANKLYFPEAYDLVQGKVFDNGNIMLAQWNNKLYTSFDSLQTIQERTSELGITYHTPANLDYPGNYLAAGNVDPIPIYYKGKEMFVWGSVGNVPPYGAGPVYLFYTYDQGATIKPFYLFGQNPNYRDDGSAGGSNSTGTLLGDASNPLYTRHWHGTIKGDDSVTGDTIFTYYGDDVPGTLTNYESFWMYHLYDTLTDTWENGRYERIDFQNWRVSKQGGAQFIGDTLWFSCDKSQHGGVWKAKWSEIHDSTKYILLYTPHPTNRQAMYALIFYGDVIISTVPDVPTFPIAYTTNRGKTWSTFHLVNYFENTTNFFLRPTLKDCDGWVSFTEAVPYTVRNGYTWYIKFKVGGWDD